jgi:hypothetical protein
MFCTPELVWGCTVGIGLSFNVLRFRTHFSRYRGRRVPFSCFALSDSFRAVSRAPGPVFLFCAVGLVLGCTKGIGSHFFLRPRTRLGLFRGRRVPFLSFAILNSFWAVPRTPGPIFMLCDPELIWVCTKGVESYFHVLRSRTRFQRCRGRQISFSCFALQDPFWVKPRALGPVFMFCAPGLVLVGTEVVGSRFHILRSQTRLGRYRGRRVPFSYFVLPDSFGAVPRLSGPIFVFCAPGPVLGGTDGARYRFHILRSRTRFGWYRGRRVRFSCFTLRDSFSEVSQALTPVFVFCAQEHIFDDTEDVGSRFHALRSRTHFRQY